jgi:4-hydroxythreonine-4-phosphate dehydrogenase
LTVPIEPRPAHARPLIAVTCGEPAGIGPELCVALARRDLPVSLVLVADRSLIASRAQQLGIDWNAPDFEAGGGKAVSIYHVPLVTRAEPGKLDARNSPYVLRTLELACDECVRGTFDAIVTAPVHKGVINDAGIAFTGHTEFLAHRTGTHQVVMMLVGGGMRVALATTHLALRAVPDAITRETLAECVSILCADLTRLFGLERPRILVAGLNPHAGESGYLGREEIDVIAPVLESFRREGHEIVGPLPADTLFNPDKLAHADAVLAMYHDQGLPVLKHASFGAGVNVTLGLPIIRTSVDHGTALDLAGTGRADTGSLEAAVALAAELVQHKRRQRAPQARPRPSAP